MFKFRLLILLLLASSAQATGALLSWDDRELGTGLHVCATGKDKENKTWEAHEIQVKDAPFYQNLFHNNQVMRNIGDGNILPLELITEHVTTWSNRFIEGIPRGQITIEQNEEPVGCAQLFENVDRRPGVGELIFTLIPSAQEKGLGKSILGFIAEEWAPTVRNVALNQYIEAPSSAIDKFKCFGNKELQLIYATARPSNPASWKSFQHFNFHPSQPTDEAFTISCVGWEESQHGPLEEYIIGKYFSSIASDKLQVDVLYDMLDENEEPKTLSFVDAYQSLRYHFEHEVKN